MIKKVIVVYEEDGEELEKEFKAESYQLEQHRGVIKTPDGNEPDGSYSFCITGITPAKKNRN